MSQANEQEIFLTAIDIEDVAERDRYLDEACGEAAELRAQVDRLLQAHNQPVNLLDRSPVEGEAEQWLDLVGTRVDHYRLMEQIGEGGFGLVFVAEQEKPVRRRVALKVVKPGMGSKEVVARFEAERQALALMDHPNIAQVFDAGVTPDGRPYFVMELVRGVTITEFADARRLTIEERAELFTHVCTAVHHAHQKGVIHRDIKPSNVMVTLHDDRAVVKVIDFGVAKAMGQTLTEKTIYTRFFSMIGTPLYMSPEQAEMSGLDVDTRSDIYSLGVLLYELLAGITPLDRERMNSVGLDEMRKIIREEEPLRPSLRLTTLGDRVTTVSAARRTEPSRLTHSLKGDLDWIVMKALEKDRNRRYDSAAAMAADIQRSLAAQPIEARPPTVAYQLSKFARRQRVALATFSLVATALLAGTVASLWQMNRAIDERDQKDRALLEANEAKLEVQRFAERISEANVLVSSAQAHATAGRYRAATSDFDQAVRLQPNYYLPWVSRAQFYTQLRLWPEAAGDYSTAMELGAPTNSPQWWGVSQLFVLTNDEESLSQLASQLDARLAPDQKIEDWDFVRACLACNEQINASKINRLADWCEQQLASGPWQRGPDSRRPPPNGSGFGPQPPPRNPEARGRPPAQPGNAPRPLREYITGLANLRAGRCEQAVLRLEEAHRDRGWPSHDIALAPFALACSQLGRQEEAEQALKRSREGIARLCQEVLEQRRSQYPWFDLVEMICYYREAESQVLPQPVALPLVEQIRELALSELNED